MLYVLANPAGSLYQYDRGGVFHNSSLMSGPPDRRRAGALVLVFEGSALADRFVVRHALFGDHFQTRPARPGDLLGGSVCRVSWADDGRFSYEVVPTPSDATPAPSPPSDGGYPADGDLHQMTDDGGPPAPDPAPWSDPDWRDDPGGPNPPADGTGAPLVCPDCGKTFTPALGDLVLHRPSDRGRTPGPGQLTVRCPHCGMSRAVRWGARRPHG